MAPLLTVSDFVAVVNQTLEYIYPVVEVEGEVASFKINQGKYVFFDLKDESSTVGCFMMLFQLRVPIEEGMKVIVTAVPKLTQWGKFSLTVKFVRLSGEGSIKKSFDLLRAALDKEGLFAPERKRSVPTIPQHIGVISSPQAAGYADFVKILNDRWAGLRVDVAAVAVQGVDAPDQIIRALQYFNGQEEVPEVIVIIRGGGSADDLSTFNDEQLVRAIAASRVPVLTGIGHEVDVTLCDLAADVRAATPSNAAQIIVPDKRDFSRLNTSRLQSVFLQIQNKLELLQQQLRGRVEFAADEVENKLKAEGEYISHVRRLLVELDPQRVLERGYALVKGVLAVGGSIEVETRSAIMKARIEKYEKK